MRSGRFKRKPIESNDVLREAQRHLEQARVADAHRRLHAEAVAENYRAAMPIEVALNEAGLEVSSLSSFRVDKENASVAVPVLLAWLPRAATWDVKCSIAAALATRWAGTTAARALLAEFRDTVGDNPAKRFYKAILANALAELPQAGSFDDLVSLVQDRHHGAERRMLVVSLGRTRDQRALEVLHGLLADDQVSAAAVRALGDLRDERARAWIEPWLGDPEARRRHEARRAIAKLDTAQRHLTGLHGHSPPAATMSAADMRAVGDTSRTVGGRALGAVPKASRPGASARDEWYRSPDWDAAAQARFGAGIQRSRGDFHRAQYTKVKALALLSSGRPEARAGAYELLSSIFSAYPEERRIAADAHEILGQMYEADREFELAEEEYRLSIRDNEPQPTTPQNSHLRLVELIVGRGSAEKYPEAMALLDRLRDPSTIIGRFGYCIAGARLALRLGKDDRAADFAEGALALIHLHNLGVDPSIILEMRSLTNLRRDGPSSVLPPAPDWLAHAVAIARNWDPGPEGAPDDSHECSG